MSVRSPIVVGIAVISMVAVAWLVLRHPDEDPNPPRSGPPNGSETLTSDVHRDGGARIAAPVGPTLADARLPGAPALPDTPTPSQQFAGQPRDLEWAAPTEDEIKSRWKRIRGGAL